MAAALTISSSEAWLSDGVDDDGERESVDTEVRGEIRSQRRMGAEGRPHSLQARAPHSGLWDPRIFPTQGQDKPAWTLSLGFGGRITGQGREGEAGGRVIF